MSEHRSKRWIVILVSVVALLVIALVATEVAMRKIVPETMANMVRDTVNLSDDHPIEVEVAGYLTPQVVLGTFNRVHLNADDVPIAEGIRASVSGVAHDLPRDVTSNELGETHLTAKFTQEQLTEVLRVLSRGVGQSLEIEGDRLSISNEITLFGQGIPITVAFFPSVVERQLHIEPISVDAAGVLSLTVDQLKDFQIFAPYADGIDLCVAEYLPAGVHLDALALSTTKTLAVTVKVSPEIGMDESLHELGVCE